MPLGTQWNPASLPKTPGQVHPGYGRSYTLFQEMRDLVATLKLIPVKEVICGNRIILCEDSIVREPN